MPIDDVLSKLRDAKRFRTGDDVTIEFLRTPSIRLDRELGGGFGRGRMSTIWGSKSAGKTSLALQVVGMAQQDGLTAAFVDAEGTFDRAWAAKLGVNNKELLYDDPKSMDAIDSTVCDLLRAGVDVLLLDSITAGVPSAMLDKAGEYAGASSNNSIGQKARQTAKLIEGWNLLNEGTAILVISQQRKRALTKSIWADRSTNGQSLEYYSSQILRLASSQSRDIKRTVRDGGVLLERPVGREVDWTVYSNKLGPQFGTGTYDFYFAGPHIGVDQIGELVDAAVEYGLVVKSGTWYDMSDAIEHDGFKKLQGRDNLVELVRPDDELREQLEGALRGLFKS